MRDDEDDQRRRGSGTLLAAWLAFVLLLGGGFGYAFLVPTDTGELDRYGSAVLPLTRAPAPAPAPSSEPAPASETEATTRESATATTAGTATTTGSGTAADVATATAGAAREATSAPADGGTGTETDAATGSAASTTAPEPEAVPEPPPAPETSGGTAAGQGTDPAATQTARVPESRVVPDLPEPETPAWQRFANVLDPPESIPRIAVIVRGLGLSSATTEAAIKRLPAEISLSFSPYARRSVEWSLRARSRGHEVLMDLPMEPESFPADDPGPQALMTSLPTPTNLKRVDWALGQAREVVGVVGQMGSAFVKSRRAMSPVLRRLKQLGRIYVDNGDVPGNEALVVAEGLELPHAVSIRTVDQPQVSRPAIEARLVEVERLAQQGGVAVVLANPYPVTIDTLAAWSRELDDRGMALVPITNALEQPGGRTAAGLR